MNSVFFSQANNIRFSGSDGPIFNYVAGDLHISCNYSSSAQTFSPSSTSAEHSGCYTGPMRTYGVESTEMIDLVPRHSAQRLLPSTNNNDSLDRNPFRSFVPDTRNITVNDSDENTSSVQARRHLRRGRRCTRDILTADDQGGRHRPSQNNRTSTRNPVHTTNFTLCTYSSPHARRIRPYHDPENLRHGRRANRAQGRAGYDQPHSFNLHRRNSGHGNAGSFSSTTAGLTTRRTQSNVSEFPTINGPPPPPTYSERGKDRLVQTSDSEESRPPPSYNEVWDKIES
ncbi:hypothetical protein BT96DRAFT_921096 [Gymnopus androsaceus JB14]|uniref:Uncharacterized protein n=1 Tax=Gymnopus androsaceus JB14 TaxID=1447944 RepID=A0A6A4HKD1_9AGAR|nr:hypothetical protein BT96DRAFT_921096 [Gymnopus androsaceus JB14]